MAQLGRPLRRRLALALAAAQLLAYAAAPLIESRAERAPGPVALERTHTASCVVLHAPDSCLACQLLTIHGQRPEGACVPLAVTSREAATNPRLAAWTPRAPPGTLHSRAPPTHLA